MPQFESSILDVTITSTGDTMQGSGSTTVLLDGHPVVLEGSVSSSGATVLSLTRTGTVEIEGKLVARPGDALSDGSVLQTRKVG